MRGVIASLLLVFSWSARRVVAFGGVLPPKLLGAAHRALESARVDQIRCPFWRRRATDVLDAGENVLRFLAARHKSLLAFPPEKVDVIVAERTSVEVAEELRKEFVLKRYYVTGRLNQSLYSSDAFFDAPDPDMPVRGPAKFADALSGLFDPRASSCELVRIDAVSDRAVVALWRLEGVLRLPWRPEIAPFVGETTYTLDDRGIITSHVERWSCSVLDAFLSAATSRSRTPIPPTVDQLRQDPDLARSLII